MTVASKAYADLLCKCPSYAMVTTTGENKYNWPPRMCKKQKLELSFDPIEFPPLKTDTATSTTTTKPATMTTTKALKSPASSIKNPQTFDYCAKLNCLSTEIKTKLMKQFKNMFTQMDQKINSLVMQHTKSCDKQEKVNIQVTKQLSFLIENMKKFLK